MKDDYVIIELLAWIFIINVPFRYFIMNDLPIWQLIAGIIAVVISVIVEIKHIKDRRKYERQKRMRKVN